MTPREPFKRSGHLHSPSTARNPHAPPDSALTAPLIGHRTKVLHCSLQSDRRVPFEEVCPIATILTADADTEGINSTIRRLRRSAE